MLVPKHQEKIVQFFDRCQIVQFLESLCVLLSNNDMFPFLSEAPSELLGGGALVVIFLCCNIIM